MLHLYVLVPMAGQWWGSRFIIGVANLICFMNESYDLALVRANFCCTYWLVHNCCIVFCTLPNQLYSMRTFLIFRVGLAARIFNSWWNALTGSINLSGLYVYCGVLWCLLAWCLEPGVHYFLFSANLQKIACKILNFLRIIPWSWITNKNHLFDKFEDRLVLISFYKSVMNKLCGTTLMEFRSERHSNI